MRKNQEYKNAALAALRGSWPQAIVATAIVLVLAQLAVLIPWGMMRLYESGACSQLVSVALSVVVTLLYMYLLVMPVMTGFINAFSSLTYKSDRALLENLKSMTFDGYFRYAAGMFLMSMVTSVCSLALIVPGVIASLSLFLTPYILHDNPDLPLVDAMRLSRKMMHGHKMQLFKLTLGFIGWELLNVLTLGIGTLWLVPYIMSSMAAFYQDVREQYIMKGDPQGSAS